MSELHDLGAFRVSPDVLGAYNAFVDAAESCDLADALEHALRAVTWVDRFYLFQQSRDLQCPPDIIAARYEAELDGPVDRWRRRFRFTDPLQTALTAAGSPGSVVFLSVGPQDISEPEYRGSCFDQCGIIQRISIVQRRAERWLVFNAARRGSNGRFSDRDLAGISALIQLVGPLAAQQREFRRTTAVSQDVETQELERRFAETCPEITRRERQVCARSLIGMTAEATALDLGIGKASVQTYRKRAYRRLGISSLNQLARLVLR